MEGLNGHPKAPQKHPKPQRKRQTLGSKKDQRTVVKYVY